MQEWIKAETERLRSKYGKNLTAEQLKKKLQWKRQFFDSAEYFRSRAKQAEVATQKVASPSKVGSADLQIPSEELAKLPTVHMYRRDPRSGELSKASSKPFTPQSFSQLAQVQHGVLEHPLGTQPRPVMFVYDPQQQGVSIVSHPEHTKRIPEEDLRAVTQAADKEFKNRFGNLPRSTGVEAMMGRGKPKPKRFDSANWALELAGIHQYNNY